MSPKKPAPVVEAVEEPEEAPIAEGFVRCVNPDLGGAVADLPESALGIHRARGWIPVDEPTTPAAEAPAPADPQED